MFNFAVKKGFFLYHKQSSWWEGLLLPGTHDLPMLHRVPHLCEMLGQLSTCLSPPWRSLTYWRREKSAMHNPVPEHHPGVLLHWHVAMHHPPRFNCIPFAMNIALHWFLKDQSLQGQLMRVLVWQLYRTGIAEAYCTVNNYTGPSTDRAVVTSWTIIHMEDGKMDNYTVPGLQACSCNPCNQVCQDDSSQEHTEESTELGKVTTPTAVTTWA